MKRTAIVFVMLMMSAGSLQSQTTYDLKRGTVKNCEECLKMISSKPKEIKWGIQADELYNVVLYINNKAWFDKLLTAGSDGIAVDIVSKEKYPCGAENLKDSSWCSMGYLMPPLYKKDFKKNILSQDDNSLIIKIGVIPEKLREKDIEFNFMILKKKNVCYYSKFYNLEHFLWGLLDMGIYLDTLVYKSHYDTSKNAREIYMLKTKRMKFEIPFEKNKYDYQPADLKPMYDSLKLTDFNITSIELRAYSSVEGSEEKNIELQEKRAQSIAAAIQSYQTPAIQTTIQASENWVDFLNDIYPTKYNYLTALSKSEIREKLKDRNLTEELEPYLKNQRKAVIIFELEKKTKVNDLTSEQIVNSFNQAIGEANLKRAIELQQSLFDKIFSGKTPLDYLDKLEIPEKQEWGLIQGKQSTFKYLTNKTDAYEALQELQELADLMPKDGHIRYNIIALTFESLMLGKGMLDPKKFESDINKLKSYGIPSSLVKRMMINYHIIMSEYYMYNQDYANKDKSLKFINSNYKQVQLSETDILSLAQYFVSYGQEDWAIKLVQPLAKKVDVSEDILFYYLSLTIHNPEMTKKQEYRTIMLNAINVNKKRFCRMFDPIPKGGVTFQLLKDDYLKKTYCENCEKK